MPALVLPPLILASQSPRRRELLSTAGFDFRVRVQPVEEVRMGAESPVAYARRLAQTKAEAVWQGTDEVILGADTIVVLGESVLEKPVDAADAHVMLKLLQGKDHTVITGICLRHARGRIVDYSSSTVRFVPMTDSEIADYIASDEPMDKAGAYGIQGLASKFVERIDGCYFNVMGLPVSLVYKYLKQLAQKG